jgi:hypothetical protein
MSKDAIELAKKIGRLEMLGKALEILTDKEWHEESKDFTSQTQDLRHEPEYCMACQLAQQFLQAGALLDGEQESDTDEPTA